MEWMHGYHAERGYTHGFYSETTPVRLRWAALLQGQGLPERSFCHLDLGCGQGFNLVLAAAAHPDASFVGIDFLPEHIAHGRALADAAGLLNVEFIEGDFLALAEKPGDLEGQFDEVVAHGIATWVSDPVKAALFRLAGRALRPGGVFYNSYNTLPGWLPMVPFQQLVVLEQQRRTADEALVAARQSFAALKETAAILFKAQPSLEKRLEGLDGKDPVYLVQEYNNAHWRPVFVSEMLDDLAAVKLSYLGSATLPEAFDGMLGEGLRTLLAAQPTVALREQLRDLALNQSFRRDLSVKGRLALPARDQVRRLSETVVRVNPLAKRPAEGEAFEIKGGAAELKGRPEIYGPLLAALDDAPDGLSVSMLMERVTALQGLSAAVQAVSMLMQGGWIALAQPDVDREPGRRLNRVIAEGAFAGRPYAYLSAPQLGGALHMSDIDMMLAALERRGVASGERAEALRQELARRKRTVQQDGKPVTDPAQVRQILAGSIARYETLVAPCLA